MEEGISQDEKGINMQDKSTSINRTAALHSLGCKVNAYETEAMQEQLSRAGYRIVPFAPGADVYVINTCSVTNIADRKSRQMLHRAKKMNPEAVVVAVGCYVQTAVDKTGAEIEADIILGNNKKAELVSVLDRYFSSKEITCIREMTQIGQEKQYEQLSVTRPKEHTRAFIKVQDGCNQFCSYCIIPYARGRVRSRTAEDVLREADSLVQKGIREIVLTGTHLSSYGVDHSEEITLLSLIRSLSQIRGLERIRLGSLEPRIVTEEFVKELSEIPQVCPHFHLSLQSGSNSVLKRMNRRYDTAEFEEKCELLRSHFDMPALTTDIIAGFPQETEEEFEETLRFLEKIRFYETHIFKYSRREGTRAASMSGQVSEQVKTARSSRLIALGEQNKAAFIRSWTGKEVQVLFEEEQEIGGRRLFTGYTKEYIRAYCETRQDLTNRLLFGKLRTDPDAGLLLEPQQM